ncbi:MULTISPECIES: hypothetical protein [unclassified Streptomyces]|uniref:hypothetical protein n=1 Tax=unclassified Streptomyces TaxID=2593676 RepID=UPI000361784A|nr:MULTISPECIES: hypothetical protein [unclassified Streptomyces]MYX31207.1 hypothetical protein [Streptomyces sp. SID8381]
MSLKPLAQFALGQEDTRVTSATVLKFSDFLSSPASFGTDVNVTPPPAADTADVTDKLIRSGTTTARTG